MKRNGCQVEFCWEDCNLEKYFELYGNGIRWRANAKQQHLDNLEMAGFLTDFTVTYGVGEHGLLVLNRHCIFPTLRLIPNVTSAAFQLDIPADKIPRFSVNGNFPEEYASEFRIDGTLTAVSETRSGVRIERTFYPASDIKCAVERIRVTNASGSEIQIGVNQAKISVAAYGRGTKGVYVDEVSHDAPEYASLAPQQSMLFHVYYSARIANEPPAKPDGEKELENRKNRIRELTDPLSLDTGNPLTDTMYRFAKIRAGESIFRTLTGLLHSPGGTTYFAATWCNDEVQYANPWFAFTGDPASMEASMNAYREYMPFMSDTYEHIPSSVIAEGLDIWEGAGDRGDAAMYLCGGSAFALCSGNRKYAEELWPALKWCAEYCERKRSPEGVIMSDSDELEGRFPTDHKANLNTSCLCCLGLKRTAILADELGEPSLGTEYRRRAVELEKVIEKYFGATLHGFRTYRYSKGFDTLRAWICLPVCAGINDRLDETLSAMLSDYLWTEDGMLSCELGAENTSRTVWDRSTLYGFRSAFYAGRGNKVWNAFQQYCEKRLLCDRVPYAIEAYPEGNKRHLSGESALFCRIITEGLLGISPEGLNCFSFMPQLPNAVDHLYLSNIHAFGSIFSIYVDRNAYRVEASGKVISSGKNGSRIFIKL